MNNNLMAVWEFINKNQDMMNKLDKASFQALICMIMEEWCKANDDDVVKFSEFITEAVRQINAELGKY